MFLFVADEVLSDGTQQHSTGRGVCYFKLMNKTSWQELFWQISGALVAALCQDSVLKLVRVHDKNNSCTYSPYLPRPNPEGTSEVWVLTICVFLCVRVCAWNVYFSQSQPTYIIFIIDLT